MKSLFSKILRFFGFYHIPRSVRKILKEVSKKVEEVAALREVSSEGKRSMVYGSIVKRSPNVRRRHVAMAIEIVMSSKI